MDGDFWLFVFCGTYYLMITNTLFQLRNKHKTSWKHPRSGQWHILDYILLRQRDKRDVFLTRAMRGAEGCTDHRMVRSVLGLRLVPKSRLCASNKRLNVAKLRDTNTRTSLVSNLELSCPEIDFTEVEITDALLTSEWDRISAAMMECAERVLGRRKRKHRDCLMTKGMT